MSYYAFVWCENQGEPWPHIARILFFVKLPGSSPGDAPGTKTVRLAVCELWVAKREDEQAFMLSIGKEQTHGHWSLYAMPAANLREKVCSFGRTQAAMTTGVSSFCAITIPLTARPFLVILTAIAPVE